MVWNIEMAALGHSNHSPNCLVSLIGVVLLLFFALLLFLKIRQRSGEWVEFGMLSPLVASGLPSGLSVKLNVMGIKQLFIIHNYCIKTWLCTTDPSGDFD